MISNPLEDPSVHIYLAKNTYIDVSYQLLISSRQVR